MDDSKRFASVEDERDYWRKTAEKFKQDLEETKEELEEFQISSRELELELEAQLEQLETKNKDNESQKNKFQTENEALREKLGHQQSGSHKRITELEDELAEVTAFKDELQKYIRELEQTNDDLERAKRATVVSLEDFEGRLNQALEVNVFLQSEVEEKECLAETVQRLKDETRDLKQELGVKKAFGGTEVVKNESEDSTVTTPTGSIDSNKLVDSGIITSQSYKTPPMKGLPPTINGSTPLTPSARISALNIVGDLLRKVGALETKLASCRNFVKDPPREKKSAGPNSNSPRSDYMHGARPSRAKRINRGGSVPPQQGAKIPV
ncbi:nuclear distribution protein nudE homolog 1-like isoform X1 [Mytilus californianus]|uniref:nuclear distribution protein nudE homolog 1-like isoform X1 n=1 Tax=Mytilus californianus TaxID=6549 RepID=UPI00224803E8|nr:nuclear distribution protein nudE homolog 1-like isoform X1 [Mytilus californianus]